MDFLPVICGLHKELSVQAIHQVLPAMLIQLGTWQSYKVRIIPANSCLAMRRAGSSLKTLKFLEKRLFVFKVLWIDRDAGDWADFNALRCIEVANAFGTPAWVNHVVIVPHGNGIIGALWLTYITIDAFIGDHQCHAILPVCALLPTHGFSQKTFSVACNDGIACFKPMH